MFYCRTFHISYLQGDAHKKMRVYVIEEMPVFQNILLILFMIYIIVCMFTLKSSRKTQLIIGYVYFTLVALTVDITFLWLIDDVKEVFYMPSIKIILLTVVAANLYLIYKIFTTFKKHT